MTLTGRAVALLLALAAVQGGAATAATLAEARAAFVASPAQGLALVPGLRDGGHPAEAERLQRGLLAEHIAQLDGAAPWPAPRPLAPWIDGPGPDAAALAAAWQRAFNLSLGQQPVRAALPQRLRPEEGRLQAVGPGAWAAAAPGPVRLAVVLEVTNQGPTALPLAAFGLEVASAELDCEPRLSSSGRAGAAPVPVIEPAGRAVFDCLGHGDTTARDAFVRHFGGAVASAATLRPRHFAQPEATAALARAVAMSAPPSPAAAPAAARRPARVAPPATNVAVPAVDAERRRVWFAVAAAAGFVALLIRLLWAAVGGEAPGPQFRRGVVQTVALLAVVALVGSAPVQTALAGAGRVAQGWLQGAVAALAASPDPTGARAGRLDGFASGLLAVGFTLFLLFGALLRLGAHPGMVRFGVAVVLLFFGVAGFVALGPALVALAGSGVMFWPVLVLVAGGALLAVAASLGTLGTQRLLEGDGRGWGDNLARVVGGTLDFGGRAGRGEFWAYLISAAFLWALLYLLIRPWDRWAALLLALPVPALIARRWRGMGWLERLVGALWLLLVALRLWPR